MPRIIEAIYENGVFKPLQKVDLKEGERVKVEIKESVVERTRGVLKNSRIDEIIEGIESEGIF